MSRVRRGGRLALLGAALLVAGPAGAGELTTTVDLDYTYTQEHLDEDVEAKTQYNQKFEVRYETSLTSAMDFVGAVRLELEDIWYTDEANTSKVAPTLELEAKGEQTAVKIVYEGVATTADLFEEEADTEKYTTSLSGELQVKPTNWPDVKLKLQHQRDYEPWVDDSKTDTLELSARQDVRSLRLEFNLKLEEVDQILPATFLSSSTEWSGKATFKEVLWAGTEFELSYEIKESYAEEEDRGVFSGQTEDYTQQVKSRLKNSLQLTPRMTFGALWEYQFDQDLLQLNFDHKLKNKYGIDLRWDLMDGFKVTSEATRETEMTAAIPGEDDQRRLTDTLKGGFDITPTAWFRFTGKAEIKSEGRIAPASGASVDQIDSEKYELSAKNKFGTFWDLTVNATTASKREDGWLVERETKLKGELRLKLANLGLTPSYETARRHEWEWGFDEPSLQRQVRDGKIKLEYKLQLLDLITATFSHEYGIKCEDVLDDVLNFERTLEMTENTRFNVVLAEFIRDLRLEGEIERKGSDTELDPDPELVEVSWVLKLDWKLDELTLASSFKYNDKGDDYDDLSFNTKVMWKGERLELTGEYQFDKVYAELTDEDRKLNLKLNYKF